jgi:hypothetical protein
LIRCELLQTKPFKHLHLLLHLLLLLLLLLLILLLILILLQAPLNMNYSALLISLMLVGGGSAFVQPPSNTKKSSFVTAQKALWRHFVPRQDHVVLDNNMEKVTTVEQQPPLLQQLLNNGLVAAFVLTALSTLPANAVSGGGLDYAGLDITGQDFASGNYKGKDFTQTIAKGTKFMNSNLQGCRFYKAFLVRNDILYFVLRRLRRWIYSWHLNSSRQLLYLTSLLLLSTLSGQY